jgi:hypothetical protein
MEGIDQMERDRLAWDRYAQVYNSLCSSRKQIIDGLIKASMAVPKELLDGKEPTATQARMQAGG